MEKEDKKSKIYLIIFVAMLLFAIILTIIRKADAPIVVNNNKTPKIVEQDIPKTEEAIKQDILSDNEKLNILGNKDDLIYFSTLPYTRVFGILSYRGSIKGGYFSEGNILINILDQNKKVLKKSNAVAKTDWITSNPVEFEGNIDFTGLKKGPAYFEIHNDNASGLKENDKSILIPIIID